MPITEEQKLRIAEIARKINDSTDADYYRELVSNGFSAGGGIHIKSENRGKFTALKERTGHSATWFKEHGTPAQKKMATFALNARHWNHADGGLLREYDEGGDKPVKKREDFSPGALKRLIVDVVGPKFYPNPVNVHGDFSRMFWGRPLQDNQLYESEYRPAKEKDKTSKYYSVHDSAFLNDLVHLYNSSIGPNLSGSSIKPLLQEGQNLVLSGYQARSNSRLDPEYVGDALERHFPGGDLRDEANPKSVVNYPLTNSVGALGNFTVGRGHDERGDYLSYYDLWDLNGLTKITRAVDKRSLGKPYELYDRIYGTFDDNGMFHPKGELPAAVVTSSKKCGGSLHKFDEGGKRYSTLMGTLTPDALPTLLQQFTPNRQTVDYPQVESLNLPEQYVPEPAVIRTPIVDLSKYETAPEVVVPYTPEASAEIIANQEYDSMLDNILNRQRYAESAFNDRAVNKSSGATGAYQIMPIAYKDYLQRGHGKEGDLMNASYNRLVRDHVVKMVPRDLGSEFYSPADTAVNKHAKEMAVFNAGAGPVKRALRKAKAAGVDIVNTTDWIQYLPSKETRDYVNFVVLDQDIAGTGKNAEAYNRAYSRFQNRRDLGGMVERMKSLYNNDKQAMLDTISRKNLNKRIK